MNFWLKRKKLKATEWFRGRFQNNCKEQKIGYNNTIFYSQYIFYGAIRAQHCDCENCNKYREDKHLEKCTEENLCRPCLYKKEIKEKSDAIYNTKSYRENKIEQKDAECIAAAIAEGEKMRAEKSENLAILEKQRQ